MKRSVIQLIFSGLLLAATTCLAERNSHLQATDNTTPQPYIAPSIKIYLLNIPSHSTQQDLLNRINMSSHMTTQNTRPIQRNQLDDVQFKSPSPSTHVSEHAMDLIQYKKDHALKNRHMEAWRNEHMQANLTILLD